MATSMRDVWIQITYQPMQSTMTTSLFHFYVSLSNPLGSLVHSVHLQGWASQPTQSAWAQREGANCHLHFLHWSLFNFPMGFNSGFKFLLGLWKLLFSLFSSLYCFIIASGHQILERSFFCCSPLFHLPGSQKYWSIEKFIIF